MPEGSAQGTRTGPGECLVGYIYVMLLVLKGSAGLLGLRLVLFCTAVDLLLLCFLGRLKQQHVASGTCCSCSHGCLWYLASLT